MKKIVISILGLSLIGLAYANDKTGDLKSSATIQATCLISANQIGFGAIATPLLPQSAQSEMNVKCSNASAYTIDLAYGGIYGQGSALGPVEYNLTLLGNGLDWTSYSVKNSNENLGNVYCSSASTGLVIFTTANVANAYGYTNYKDYGNWTSDDLGICNGKTIKSNKLTVGSPGYDYGIMQGSFKGDKLAYSIAVPGDSTKVWNSGNNSYKSTGNGEFQVIPVIAKIVPDQSGSKYPAPDMYLDTVTAVISY